jgi:hypothetical protein
MYITRIIEICNMQSRAYELCDSGKMQRWIVEFRDWALAEAQLPKRAQSQGSEQDHYGTDYLDRDRLKGEEIAKGHSDA